MGVDFGAKIMIGLRRESFEDQESLESWINDEKISVCPPYFDGSDSPYAVCGLEYAETGRYCPSVLSWDQEVIDRALALFKDITGQEGKVWLSPYGY